MRFFNLLIFICLGLPVQAALVFPTDWQALSEQVQTQVAEELFSQLADIEQRTDVPEVQGLLGDSENLLALLTADADIIDVAIFAPEIKQAYSFSEVLQTLMLQQALHTQAHRLETERLLLVDELKVLRADGAEDPLSGQSIDAILTQLTALRYHLLLEHKERRRLAISAAQQSISDQLTVIDQWLHSGDLVVAPDSVEQKSASQELPVQAMPSSLMPLASLVDVSGQSLINMERALSAMTQQLVMLYMSPDHEGFKRFRFELSQYQKEIDQFDRLILQALEDNVADEAAIASLVAARKRLNELSLTLVHLSFLTDQYARQFQSLAERQVGTLVTSGQLTWQGFVDRVSSIFGFQLLSINQKPLTVAGLAWLVLVLMATWWLHRVIKAALYRFASRSQSFTESSVFTIDRLLYYALMTASVFLALSVLGIDLTKFALVAGALSVGIGFGLQSIFSNFVSGLILLFERPVKVGDMIELESGVTGKVKSINVRSTQVTTPDNIDVLVPNSEFVNGRVTNFTFEDPQRRLRLPFSVEHGVDKDHVRNCMLEVAKGIPYTVLNGDREPDVWLVNIGDYSLDFELVVWVDVRNMPATRAIAAEYLWQIESALRRHEINVPRPQQDVYVRKS